MSAYNILKKLLIFNSYLAYWRPIFRIYIRSSIISPSSSWRLSKLTPQFSRVAIQQLVPLLRSSVLSPSSSWCLSELNSAVQSYRHPAAGASPSWTPQFFRVAIQQLVPLRVELRSVAIPSPSWTPQFNHIAIQQLVPFRVELRRSVVLQSSSWRHFGLNSAG